MLLGINACSRRSCSMELQKGGSSMKIVKLFLLAVACIMVTGLAASSARAEEKKLELRQGDVMADVLGRLVGSSVEVTLRSGTSLSGKLTKVHQQLAVVSELSRKEFYDAVVRIDEISAVTVRMRDR